MFIGSVLRRNQKTAIKARLREPERHCDARHPVGPLIHGIVGEIPSAEAHILTMVTGMTTATRRTTAVKRSITDFIQNLP